MPDCEQAADDLCEVTLALEEVDLNNLADRDVHKVLNIKTEVTDLCLRYRRDQSGGDDGD